ncbi:MAG: class I SAM-dependent methyltransferase [Acidobacteria bacterium]|jgi:SAM-dependent methyltransferase|nr:class I SAM-dependent methyltransferase [Acidobacteriota bacterium]MCU0253541.1 class I SAM-dependent methyltransferase [Acidobacteriota bacterium]
MDVRALNRQAWDRQVDSGNEWTRPVSPEVIAAARAGSWSVLLTEQKAVPREWFPPLAGRGVLCLASGGGQQGPILAAAGARVTVLDNSPRQLAQDQFVAARDGLALETVEGDMADLSAFADASFDLVFHPVSNCFVADVRPVWREAFRVLRPGGLLLAGFLNPVVFLFDEERADAGELVVRHALPFADTTDLAPEALDRKLERGVPLEFGHLLSDQVGGQLDAGFVLTAMYEDRHRSYAPARMTPTYIATRAVRPAC